MAIDWMTFTATEAAVFTPNQFSTFVVDPVFGTVYRVLAAGVFAAGHSRQGVYTPDLQRGVHRPKPFGGVHVAGAEEQGTFNPGAK